MFEVGKVYEFQPNPGADILVIQIISEAPMSEAANWYRRTYHREDLPEGAIMAWRGILLREGLDNELSHKKFSSYYVFNTDYGYNFPHSGTMREI